MIKPTGDSLTEIPRGNNYYHHPAWNASCTRIFAYAMDKYNVLLTPDGTITDSFSAGDRYVDFIDDDRFITGIGVYTISTGQYDRIAEGLTAGSRMISNNEFIWSNASGIHKTNIVTRQTVTLKESCESRAYVNPSVNASKTKVLWSRITSRADTCFSVPKIYQDFDIVEMNVDGTGEREIPIPE